jgi:hypothetical protein
MSKYFNIIVKPTISVAALAAGNITANEVLFDWHGFDIPKGAARLIGCTILYSGKNGIQYAATDLEVYWAKGDADGTAPASFGDDGAVVDTFGWFNNIQGKMAVDASDGASAGDLIVGEVLSVQNVTAEGVALNAGWTGELVLQGVPNSGTNVGYDKLYIGGIALATHNWGVSTMVVSTETATSTPVVVVKTLSTLITLGPGDVLRDEDDLALGTVKTVDSSTQVTLEANCASVSAVDKVVYNTTPITFVLSFEQ